MTAADLRRVLGAFPVLVMLCLVTSAGCTSAEPEVSPGTPSVLTTRAGPTGREERVRPADVVRALRARDLAVLAPARSDCNIEDTYPVNPVDVWWFDVSPDRHGCVTPEAGVLTFSSTAEMDEWISADDERLAGSAGHPWRFTRGSTLLTLDSGVEASLARRYGSVLRNM